MNTISFNTPKNLWHWLQIYKLYRTAFPKEERKPFKVIRKQYRQGVFEVWMIRKESAFSALAITAKHEDLVLIDYLAVVPEKQDQGIGSATLALMRKHYAGKRIFLEIESVYEDTPELALRQRRKQFYLRNGMTPMNVMIKLFGVNMELMGFDCRIDYTQYHNFYSQCMSSWAAGHISSLPYPLEK